MCRTCRRFKSCASSTCPDDFRTSGAFDAQFSISVVLYISLGCSSVRTTSGAMSLNAPGSSAANRSRKSLLSADTHCCTPVDTIQVLQFSDRRTAKHCSTIIIAAVPRHPTHAPAIPNNYVQTLQLLAVLRYVAPLAAHQTPYRANNRQQQHHTLFWNSSDERGLSMMHVCSPVTSLAVCRKYMPTKSSLCQNFNSCCVRPYETPT